MGLTKAQKAAAQEWKDKTGMEMTRLEDVHDDDSFLEALESNAYWAELGIRECQGSAVDVLKELSDE